MMAPAPAPFPGEQQGARWHHISSNSLHLDQLGNNIANLEYEACLKTPFRSTVRMFKRGDIGVMTSDIRGL